jgi:uncharacterized membrane protein YhaH (DUF805 family)
MVDKIKKIQNNRNIMANYLVNLGILLVIYVLIINKVDSGRCFRYEYIIKTLIVMGMEIFVFILIILLQNIYPGITFFGTVVIMVLVFYNLKFTIQRFYDLNLSGWYILLKLIPIFSIFVTFYLYFKKGNREINDYDKAINYKKIFKHKCCIDIHKQKIIIGNEIYQCDTYLDKYNIKISNYGQKNIFSEYILEKYPVKDDGIYKNIYKTVEIPCDELSKIIDILGLVVIYDAFCVKIKGFEVFIRKEDFKYTIILNKEHNKISKELFDTFDFPGAFSEDQKYIYYNRIYKDQLLMWVKNIA